MSASGGRHARRRVAAGADSGAEPGLWLGVPWRYEVTHLTEYADRPGPVVLADTESAGGMTDPHIIVDVPFSAVVVMVGLQGSGKSTLARGSFCLSEIVSSDEFRRMLSNDESSQSSNNAVLLLMEAVLAERVKNRVTTVIDATNTCGWKRRRFLAVARQGGVPAVAIVVNTPVEECWRRVAARGRVIGDEVLAAGAAGWEATVKEVFEDGFSAVHTLEPLDLAGVGFRHGLPPQDEPDRWIEVVQESPALRRWRVPADEVRRDRSLMGRWDVDPAELACVAAGRVCGPGEGVVVRVTVPHCYPVVLESWEGQWRRLPPGEDRGVARKR